MRRTTLLSSISLVAASTLSMVVAAPAAEARFPGKRLEQIAGRLGVDEPTKRQIGRMIAQSRAEAQALRAQLNKEHQVLRRLMRQELPSETAVLTQVETIGVLKLKLKKLKMTTMLRVRQLLTPDQRRALRQLRKNRRAALRQACQAALSGVCEQARARRRLRCLARHLDQLSPACRKKVVQRFGRLGQRGRMTQPRP